MLESRVGTTMLVIFVGFLFITIDSLTVTGSFQPKIKSLKASPPKNVSWKTILELYWDLVKHSFSPFRYSSEKKKEVRPYRKPYFDTGGVCCGVG